MQDTRASAEEWLAAPFTIHLINAYTNSSLPSTAEYFEMTPEQINAMLRAAHVQIVDKLRALGVEYEDLRPALTPQPRKAEIAFVFNSRAIESGDYGYEISETWIPALFAHGPAKTTIRHGDIIGLPSSAVWRELDRSLIRRGDFPRLSAELYYVVYMTNVSAAQLSKLDLSLFTGTEAYLGYVDCSTWTPLKTALPLPQIGLRLGPKVLTDTDDGGTPNQIGYPFEDHGFVVVGVDDLLYPIFLESRIDMGVPEWGETDSSISLNALSVSDQPLATLELEIDDRRYEYLAGEEPGDGHGTSLRRAGLIGLDRTSLTHAIAAEVRKSLLYNLRFVEGSRMIAGNRVADAALDALMFTVQVQFPGADGVVRRFQVGVKYKPSSHSGEVVTMFG